MAFTTSQIIQNAFYLANILSAQAEEQPSTSQFTSAINILNQILDSFGDSPYFSSFQKEQVFSDINTREIWIGPDITSISDSDKTVFVQDEFLAIFAASNYLSTGSNKPQYPMSIYSLSDLTKRYYIDSRAIPKNIYYTTLYSATDGLYNKLVLVPTPPQTGATITIFGIGAYPNIIDTSTTVLPTFSLYLQYSLGFELAMLYGKKSEWENTIKSRRLEQLYNEIITNTPIDFTINTTIDAYGNRSGGYYFNNNSS